MGLFDRIRSALRRKKSEPSDSLGKVVTKDTSIKVPSGNIRESIKKAGITDSSSGRLTRSTSSRSSGGRSSGGSSSRASSQIPSGNIQEALRKEGIETAEQGRLKKRPTQQSLRDVGTQRTNTISQLSRLERLRIEAARRETPIQREIREAAQVSRTNQRMPERNTRIPTSQLRETPSAFRETLTPQQIEANKRRVRELVERSGQQFKSPFEVKVGDKEVKLNVADVVGSKIVSKIQGKDERRVLEAQAKFKLEQKRKEQQRVAMLKAEQEAPFLSLSPPAMVRRGFFELGKIGSKAAEVPFKVTKGRGFNPAERQASAEVIGTTLLFSGFDVATPTTTQLQRAASTRTKLGVIGVTSQKDGVSQTAVRYATKTGRKRTFGIGTSLGKDLGDGRTISVSKSGRVRTGIEFPSGRISQRLGKTSDALTFSLSRNIDEGRTAQLSLTGAKQGKQTSRQLELLNIKETDNLLSFKGKGVGKSGDVDISGIIQKGRQPQREISSGPGQKTISLKSSQLQKETIKSALEAASKQASKQTQKAVSKIISEKRAVPPLPFLGKKPQPTQQVQPKTETMQITTPIKPQAETQVPKITQGFTQAPRTRTKTSGRTRQTQEPAQSQKEETAQTPKLIQETRPSQEQKQPTRLLERLAQQPKLDLIAQRFLQRPRTQPPATKTPLISVPRTPSTSSFTPKKTNGFEAVGFKFGKEVSLGFGTKTEAAKSLKGFLTGGLSASGFLREKETGKEVKAKELLGLFGEEFRVGKRSPSLIVERKSKRLRKGGTGKQIQFFR